MKYYLGLQIGHIEYGKIVSTKGTYNTLFSYADCQDADKTIKYIAQFSKHSLIIDSGAFSAWNTGKVIDFRELLSFYKKIIAFRPDINLINFDVIPARRGVKPTTQDIYNACEQSLNNYRQFKREGLNVLPVFHQHDDFKYLEIYKQETDYICISPSNDCSTNERILWLDRVYSNLKADYKTHSLAGTSLKLLERYPFYSCDSINWKAPVMFGRSITNLHIPNTMFSTKQTRKLLLEQEINYYLKLQSDITNLWEKRGVKWQN